MLFFVCPAKTMYRLDQRQLPRSFVPHHSGGCGVAWRTNLLWTPAATNEGHEREPGLGAAFLAKVFFFLLRWKSVGVDAMRATSGVIIILFLMCGVFVFFGGGELRLSPAEKTRALEKPSLFLPYTSWCDVVFLFLLCRMLILTECFCWQHVPRSFPRAYTPMIAHLMLLPAPHTPPPVWGRVLSFCNF